MAKAEGGELSGKYPKYEDDPALVLEEAKAILEELRGGDEHFHLMNSETPAYACSALLKFYADRLSVEDISFCTGIVVSYACAPFQEGYDYQMNDGVEVAVSTLPTLYALAPEGKSDYNTILLLTLFDTYPLGEYKRICDYAIEALQALFETSPADANAVLLPYMLLKPKFDADNPRGRRMTERMSRVEVLQEFIDRYAHELEAIGSDESSAATIDFATQSLQTAETVISDNSCRHDRPSLSGIHPQPASRV